MTEAMNFFQSIITFKNLSPASISSEEFKLASSLKNEARELAATADEEMRNGQTARDLAFDAGEKEKIRVFTEIAVWHNTRAAEKYRRSAGRFEEAGKIQITKRKACNLMAKEMTRRAAVAEAAVSLLSDSLKQN
jgi:hypothetical protein